MCIHSLLTLRLNLFGFVVGRHPRLQVAHAYPTLETTMDLLYCRLYDSKSYLILSSIRAYSNEPQLRYGQTASLSFYVWGRPMVHSFRKVGLYQIQGFSTRSLRMYCKLVSFSGKRAFVTHSTHGSCVWFQQTLESLLISTHRHYLGDGCGLLRYEQGFCRLKSSYLKFRYSLDPVFPAWDKIFSYTSEQIVFT